MDMLKKYFPLSFKVTELITLIVNLILYAVAGAVVGMVCSLLDGIPLIGIAFWLLGILAGLYSLTGIVLAVLVFCKVLK